MISNTNLLADASSSVFYQFARLHSLSEWWHWLLMLVLVVGILAYTIFMYVRDCVDLSRPLAVGLMVLRIAAFGGILFYFLDLEKRAERKVVKNSRVCLLVDTSQSMGLRDSDSTPVPASPSRIEYVTDLLGKSDFIKDLRAKHDVVAYKFDQGAKPEVIASFTKLPSTDGPQKLVVSESDTALRQARLTAIVAGGLLAVSVIAGLVYLLFGRAKTGEQTSWALLVSIVFLIASVVVLGVANLRSPDVDLLAILGLREATISKTDDTLKPEAKPEDAVVEWEKKLLPQGTQTRIGDALAYLVNQERGGPIAGVVLFSDGVNNVGIDPPVAIAAAKAANIPVYTVGLGSDRRPINVRVVDLEAPQRVYPGDKFVLSGYVQATGMDGRTIKLELFSAPVDPTGKVGERTFEQDLRVTLKAETDKPHQDIVQTLRFEATQEELGRRTYFLKVVPPEQDHDPRDNEKSANVVVVERKNQVLIVAGGPSREYQFVRNLLYRDKRTSVSDVWLQTARPGTAQESREQLAEFPEDEDDLFKYDCIIAFDPDWTKLNESQVKMLERWVAEKAGGLIVVAGPVHTPVWTMRRNDPRMDVIRALYPVVFYTFGSPVLSLGRFGGESAWPLSFTREGLEAEQLWLADNATDSEATWSSFAGVYGYYAVKDPKLGATVYARFSDPETSIDNEQPIYLASHFYGAGRVFFQASGEMWRIRALDDSYFEQYYTKLIRWVSHGRLLRDSSRGVLLVDKERCLLGDQIGVRAILTNAQHKPLEAEEVTAMLIQPDNTRLPLVLRKVQDGSKQGMFAGQFMALQEGDYRVEMNIPDSATDEVLSREVRSRVEQREVVNPERNDALLTEIANTTGGEYFVGVKAAAEGSRSLVNRIDPQDQTSFLPGTPDKNFERILMTWLMGLICGVLCLEWLVRRINKLA